MKCFTAMLTSRPEYNVNANFEVIIYGNAVSPEWNTVIILKIVNFRTHRYKRRL